MRHQVYVSKKETTDVTTIHDSLFLVHLSFSMNWMSNYSKYKKHSTYTHLMNVSCKHITGG